MQTDNLPTLRLVEETAPDPVRALSTSRAILDSTARGESGPTLRLYTPQPTAAFGARDRFAPGFPTAVAQARAHGFTPTLRSLGGRVAVYHEDCLIVDHVEPADSLYGNTRDRFAFFAELFRRALERVGVHAEIGEIPGEYCPGEFSLSVGGRIKVIGTAQRVTQGAWLFSSSIIVGRPDPIRRALTAIQASLGVEWNPQTGGAISEVCPRITAGMVRDAVLAEYAAGWRLVEQPLPAEVVNAAHRFDAVHRL